MREKYPLAELHSCLLQCFLSVSAAIFSSEFEVSPMIHCALKEITDFIFMKDDPFSCDVILIPGTSQSAITEKAASLYREGWAPYVLPSGGFSSSLGHFAREKIDNLKYDGDYASEFAYCRRILMENGVPEHAILREDRATNSMENAMYSAAVLKAAGIFAKRAIVCCQSFHARRAFLSYTCHFPGTELRIVPAVTQGISAENWYLSEKGFQKVMREVAKCGTYFLPYKEAFCHAANAQAISK